MSESKNKSLPKKPLTDAPMGALEQNLMQAMAQSFQLERTIWLLVREAGGAVAIDEASINPLWDLKYDRVEGHKTLLKISATDLPDATEGQIRKLAELLADKPEAATPSALLECGLSAYPASYVIGRLAPLVVCSDGWWKKR